MSKLTLLDKAKSLGFDPLKTYHAMAKTRAMEERMIKMSKSSDGFFWIGGPGEEGFNIPLGQLIHKGEGLNYDYMHFHYRNAGTMLTLGTEMIDVMRQMAAKATDPFSGGRNFVGHFAKKEWNVMPVTSPIETQYAFAPGTAWAQKRNGGKGITIVTGGDAGSAEGDFASCLNFSSRPGMELPILIIVTNNKYGISTPFNQVHGDRVISKRAEAFGIRNSTINGNDPVESFVKLHEVMEYVRNERKPFCLEAYVSRLHGHSSSSGGNRVEGEVDCLESFGKLIQSEFFYKKKELDAIKEQYDNEALEAVKIVREEPYPDGSTVFDHMYAPNH
jgi:2-oxoisovalerate dehydrogenase E1 component alpha subunit